MSPVWMTFLYLAVLYWMHPQVFTYSSSNTSFLSYQDARNHLCYNQLPTDWMMGRRHNTNRSFYSYQFDVDAQPSTELIENLIERVKMTNHTAYPIHSIQMARKKFPYLSIHYRSSLFHAVHHHAVKTDWLDVCPSIFPGWSAGTAFTFRTGKSNKRFILKFVTPEGLGKPLLQVEEIQEEISDLYTVSRQSFATPGLSFHGLVYAFVKDKSVPRIIDHLLFEMHTAQVAVLTESIIPFYAEEWYRAIYL